MRSLSRFAAWHLRWQAGPPLASLVLLALAACADTEGGHESTSDSGVILPSVDASSDVLVDAAMEAGSAPCGAGHLCAVKTPLAYGSITAIMGRSQDDVWASGSGGLLLRWTGRAWEPFGLDRTDTLSTLFVTRDETWGVAGDLAVRASAAPKSVRATRLESGGSMRSLSVAPNGNVYVGLGSDGWPSAKILARLDFETGSLAYLPEPLLPWNDAPPTLSVRAGHHVAGEALWLVGDQGLVVRYPAALLEQTGDAGDAGDAQGRGVVLPTTSRASLLAAWGSGRQLWTAGSGGTILHFDGSAWRRAETGTTATLHAIFGLSPTDIWAAGDDGIVLHYDGATWTVVDPSSPRGSLRAIWAAGTNDVWIGGEGVMLHWGALP